MLFRAEHLAVQGRLARLAVAVPAPLADLFMSAGRDRSVIAQASALGDDIAERIDHHRAAILELIVIHADRVGKNSVNAAVVSPCRQPLHQPASALETVELRA